MTAAATSKNLMNYLLTPSRIARKVDWHKTKGAAVLAVDIGRDRIGMAVAPHPSSHEPIQALPPLSLQRETRRNRHVLSTQCVQSMASIVQEHDVCALVVSWPVQQDGSGRCGKPCGQVLHTLDALVEASNTIVTKQRPLCLWDDQHVPIPECDEWGRDPLLGKCTTTEDKTIHRASQEQYQHHDCSSNVAAQVWQDFCHSFWPQEEDQPTIVVNTTSDNDDLAEEAEDDADRVLQARAQNDNNDDDESSQEEEETMMKVALM